MHGFPISEKDNKFKVNPYPPGLKFVLFDFSCVYIEATYHNVSVIRTELIRVSKDNNIIRNPCTTPTSLRYDSRRWLDIVHVSFNRLPSRIQ